MWWTDANGHIWNGEHCDRCGWANWHPAGGKLCDGGEHVHKMTGRPLPLVPALAAAAQKIAPYVEDGKPLYPVFVSAAKPATPEPPEWGGIKFVSVPITPKESAIGFAGRMVGAGGTVTIVNADDFFAKPPEPSPLARALEDFTARRKAKRINAMAPGKSEGERPAYRCKSCGRVSETYFDCPCERTGGYISRAMSTPLPHDPPMSARLMPYRSKEP